MNQLAELKRKWNEITEGPLGWAIYLAIGVAMAFVLNIGLSIAMSTEYPVVTVESDSMEPVLYPGDIVFVRSSDSYEPGDVIVFDGWKPTPIIHRIVSMSERDNDGFEVSVWEDFDEITEGELMGTHVDFDEDRIYVTKGDKNPTCDQCQGVGEFVLDEDIHGKKMFRVPYLGWIKLASMRLTGRS